jgi:hypothetical protein
MDILKINEPNEPKEPNELNEPLAVRVSKVAWTLSMSRSAAYDAIRSGAIPAVRIAGKWRVPMAVLKKLVEVPQA